MNVKIIGDKVFIDGVQVKGEKSKPLSEMGWLEAAAVVLVVVIGVAFLLALALCGMTLTGFLVLQCLALLGYGLVAKIGWLNSLAVGFLITVAARIFGGKRRSE